MNRKCEATGGCKNVDRIKLLRGASPPRRPRPPDPYLFRDRLSLLEGRRYLIDAGDDSGARAPRAVRDMRPQILARARPLRARWPLTGGAVAALTPPRRAAPRGYLKITILPFLANIVITLFAFCSAPRAPRPAAVQRRRCTRFNNGFLAESALRKWPAAVCSPLVRPPAARVLSKILSAI
ncbi:hypothetical protein EVAR_39484_1 [Eumeta japonica]|uniref:Uncharacterized protein n=1 Tax=Eumeta variegata TaxID=151549 RepID=A0A4C1W330_EUMVA|nr:hypothetical protein EVAR_39484_1 [Eumeta japonica]